MVSVSALIAFTLAGMALTRTLSPIRPGLLEIAGANAVNPAVTFGPTRVERRLGYLTVTGSAVNTSTKSLRNVEAVVEYYDTANRLVRVDSALLEMPSVSPGMESAFAVHSRDSSDIIAYRVRFRTLLGATLPSTRAAH